MTVEPPDGAFMIVYENSVMTIQEPSAPTLTNLINAVMGKVQFYIQRFGGESNPHGAGTVTSIIAVRG